MMPMVYIICAIGGIWAAAIAAAIWLNGAMGEREIAARLDKWIIKPGALVLAVAFALLIVVGAVRVASAHEAPSGFRYDGYCCSDQDCRPADEGEIVSVSGGWHVVPSNLYVPLNDHRIHRSPDGRFHICNVTAGDRKSAFWCLYIPDFGS